MANLCVAKISSRVKGHHVYQYNYTVGEDFSCAMEPINIYSKNAIAVIEKNSNKIVGHIPEPLEITCTMGSRRENRAPMSLLSIWTKDKKERSQKVYKRQIRNK